MTKLLKLCLFSAPVALFAVSTVAPAASPNEVEAYLFDHGSIYYKCEMQDAPGVVFLARIAGDSADKMVIVQNSDAMNFGTHLVPGLDGSLAASVNWPIRLRLVIGRDQTGSLTYQDGSSVRLHCSSR